MAAKDEMRRKIQKSQNALREKKKKEREELKKNKPYVSPYERKHGKKPPRSDDMVSNKKTRSGKPKTKAQLMATKNIKKYGGTASAAAANKEAMRLKIKKRYLASKKKK